MLCLLLVGRIKERRKKRETAQGLFFLRAGHTLLAVPSRIFAAVRCN
jgi:hypothetical protein